MEIKKFKIQKYILQRKESTHQEINDNMVISQ